MQATTQRRQPKQRKQRVGLSLMAEDLLKARLRATYPSEPWVETTDMRFEDTKADGEVIVYRFHDPKAFPPPADHTPMVTCPECGRTVPPNSLEGGRCMDHQPMWCHEAYGSSPSAHAILELQHRNLRIKGASLKDESKKALRREIRRHLAGKFVVGGKKNG